MFLLLAILGSAVFFLPHSMRAKLTDSKLGQNLLLTFRSLRKLPDIAFLPYLFFKSDLPQFNIIILPENISFLNNSLPRTSPFTSISFDENRSFVEALFKNGDYEAEVELKYRGVAPNNWNAYKKSYKIVFPDNNLFKGIKEMDLIIPYERKYYSDFLNLYR